MKSSIPPSTHLLLCAVIVGLSPAHGAGKIPELELKPCMIELVDGTEIEGKLAVQFDMPEHLIVYSPRLATVRSFLKRHVHALTVNGKRRKLNPKRDLSEEDEKLLGRVRWPNEPPAEGRKPAYATERWDKPKQLMVWARPSESGRFEKLHDPAGEPEVRQTLERFELNVPDGRMKKRDGYLYTGYLEVGKTGIYRFYTETEAPSRLYIADRFVVDNHRRYRYDWNPAGSPPLESWGSLRLKPGKYRIQLEYARGRGFTGWPPWEPQENEPFKVSYEGPGIDKQPIPSDLEGFLPNTYMNQRKFGNPEGKGWTDISPTVTDPRKLKAYLEEVEAHGCKGVFFHVIHQWLKAHAKSYREHDSVNPNLETFEALETLILKAHRRGMYVHFWAWGDEGRKWTPIGLPGGKDGKVDRRVQRYIAARLAPLPGWVMGYGFDLREWTSEKDLEAWAAYLHSHMGWRHMLWGRDRSCEELDAKSYPGYGVRSYEEIVRDLASDPDRPHLYEERDTYLRNDSLSQTGTRRYVWQQAMAGGMMGFWGHYPKTNYDRGPYPRPEQFACRREFWRGRFLLSMKRANELTGGYALTTPDNKHYVFYAEDTARIEMDLSQAAGPLPAVAVDTKKRYREIDIGPLKPGKHTWKAPRKSDWAVAAELASERQAGDDAQNYGYLVRTGLAQNPRHHGPRQGYRHPDARGHEKLPGPRPGRIVPGTPHLGRSQRSVAP